MTNNGKTQRLTGRDGTQVIAEVVYHLNTWAAAADGSAAMECGMTLAEMARQTHPIHQTALSTDAATCPTCCAIDANESANCAAERAGERLARQSDGYHSGF